MLVPAPSFPVCAGLDDYKYGDAGDGDDFDFM
jgi:hypothetical protein